MPATPGSTLLKMLKKTEEAHQIGPKSRIKFIETSGRKYVDQLRVNDPYETKCQPEEKCLTCKSRAKTSNCKIANVGYSIICKTCKERGRDRTYEGESCRTAYIRGKEHIREYERKSDKSVMFKHVKKEHEGEDGEVQFEMKVVSRFKSAMNRQREESVRIQRKNPESLLNSKSEYHGPVIKRKILEGRTRRPGSS